MPIKKILVVGGAGYIGSHMLLRLKEAGYEPIVLDNLSTGHRSAVLDATFIQGDLENRAILQHIFKTYDVFAVMHFASFIQVGESVLHPAKYYLNNVANTVILLDEMVKAGIKYFIFSSSAAVYGNPQHARITEDHPLLPMNPYGHSKKMIEEMLQDFSKAYDFYFIALRYFNAAGADPQGRLTELHDPETHLIPLILQTAQRKRKAITIFGSDYPTEDGTCVRDYIHVVDLALGHIKALEKIHRDNGLFVYNLGTGLGVSVKEMIEAIRLVSGKEIPAIVGPRRTGDVAEVVSDAGLAEKELGWITKYTLQDMADSAWKWQQKNPKGYYH